MYHTSAQWNASSESLLTKTSSKLIRNTTVFCQITSNPLKQCALLLLLSSKSYANIASINIIAGQELQGHFTSDVYHKYLLNIQITLHCKSMLSSQRFVLHTT